MSDASVERESRAMNVLEEYLAALEGGVAPNRDELLARNPDVADELRAALDGLDFVHGAGRALDLSRTADRGGDEPQGVLGDYRLLREVGRGGMGVVYEAEQVSLRRRVALKVLPFAAVLDPKQLQRFRNEAQAAAQLHHSHIVPVYSVGCERGVHFYAMQYIEGSSLSRAIRELRGAGCDALPEGPATPTPLSAYTSAHEPRFVRLAADFARQAAEALDHAHECGVIHRDIKPANLLVDTFGTLWLTDFGLARFRDETRLTVSGDLVGTIRYMSPEQALGGATSVDHRTDIYSLGVTLYELLTLEPAFAGDDVPLILRAIAERDPVPPRRLNPAIPADLETVLLKAIAKEPAHRYASARELALDLQRFLENRTVVARRSTLRTRATRWVRRHRRLVVVGSSLLAVALTGLAASGLVIAREKDRAEANYRDAERSYLLARETVDEMLTQVAEGELAEVPNAEGARRRILERAVAFYLKLLDAREGRPTAANDVAHARFRLANLHRLLEQPLAAVDSYRRGISEIEELERAAPEPARSLLRRDLIGAVHNLGAVLVDAGRLDEAERTWTRALALGEATLAQGPREDADRVAVANVCSGLAGLRATQGHPREAETLLRRAMALRRESATPGPDLWFDYNGLTLVLADMDRQTESEALCREALALARRQPTAIPPEGEATLHGNLARCLSETGKLDEAVEHVSTAIALWAGLAEQKPGLPGRRRQLAEARRQLGALLTTLGRHREAAVAHRAALEAVQGIGPEGSGVFAHRRALARSMRETALLHTASGDRAAAERVHREELAVRERLAASVPQAPWIWTDQANALDDVACQLFRRGALEESEKTFLRAQETYRDVAERFPDVPVFRHNLAASQHNLASVLTDNGRLDQALRSMKEAIATDERLAEERPWVFLYGSSAVEGTYNLGVTLVMSGRDAEAEVAFVRACDRAQRLVRDFPQVPRGWDDLADAQLDLGRLLLRSERIDEAKAALSAAVATGRGLVARAPEPEDYRSGLASGDYLLGKTLEKTGNDAEADAPLTESIALLEVLASERPAERSPRKRLADARSHRADVCARLGRVEDSQREYRRVIELHEGLAAEPQESAKHRRFAARSWLNLGVVLANAGRLEEGLAATGTAIGLLDALATEVPHDPEVPNLLTIALHDQGINLEHVGKVEEALAAHRRSLALHKARWKASSEAVPNAAGPTAEAAAGVDSAYERLVWVLANADRPAEALSVCAEWVAALPSSQDALRTTAWILSSSSDLSLRDPSRARTSAEAAVRLDPESGVAWEVLGVTLYRSGLFEEARTALEKALALGHRNDGQFFLAMTLRRLGDQRAALVRYQEAVDWAVENFPDGTFNPSRNSVLRIRREAAVLLDVSR